MKLALIGLGAWAKNIIKSLPPDVSIAAVATRNPEAATLLPGVVVSQKVADLDLDDIHGAIIANAAVDHLRALAAVRRQSRRMPVFIEKPVAKNPIDLDDLFAIDDQSIDPALLLVDHTQLFNGALLTLRSQMIGPPASIRCIDRGIGPVRSDCHPLWDYGPHAVSVALFLAGFPFDGGIHVRDAWVDCNEHGSTIDFELQLGARTVAAISVGNNATMKARHCTVRMPDASLHSWEGLAQARVPPLSAALAAFCDAVRTGHAPRGDMRFGWALPYAVTQTLADVEEVLRKRCTPLA